MVPTVDKEETEDKNTWKDRLKWWWCPWTAALNETKNVATPSLGKEGGCAAKRFRC